MRSIAALIVVLCCVSLSQAQYVVPVPSPYVVPAAVPTVLGVTYPVTYAYVANPYLVAPVPYAVPYAAPYTPYASPYVVVPWWHRGIYRRW